MNDELRKTKIRLILKNSVKQLKCLKVRYSSKSEDKSIDYEEYLVFLKQLFDCFIELENINLKILNKTNNINVKAYQDEIEYFLTCNPTNEDIAQLDFITQGCVQIVAHTYETSQTDEDFFDSISIGFNDVIELEDLEKYNEEILSQKNSKIKLKENESISELYIKACRFLYFKLRYDNIFKSQPLLNLEIPIICKVIVPELIRIKYVNNSDLDKYVYDKYIFSDRFKGTYDNGEYTQIKVLEVDEELTCTKGITAAITAIIRNLNSMIYFTQYNYKIKRKMNIKYIYKENYNQLLYQQILKYEQKKLSKQQIANKLGISRRQVYKIKENYNTKRIDREK